MSMRRAYTLAAHAVRARLARQRPAMLARLDALTGRDVHVIRGVHDAAQEVLRCLGVPHRLASNFSPKAAAITIGNCGWRPANPTAVTAWVEGGGWLITSDWALGAVSQCFPDTVARKGSASTGDEVIGIEPSAESAFADVVVLGCDPQWWLESASYPIEVLDPERVVIEAASHELLRRFEAPAVATRFDWGAGHVFHVISHFWLKKTRQADARHQGSAEDFMRIGMRLDDAAIAEAFAAASVAPSQVGFAALQSAVTSTELLVRLCTDAAARRAPAPSESVSDASDQPAASPPPKPSLWRRLFG